MTGAPEELLLFAVGREARVEFSGDAEAVQVVPERPQRPAQLDLPPSPSVAPVVRVARPSLADQFILTDLGHMRHCHSRDAPTSSLAPCLCRLGRVTVDRQPGRCATVSMAFSVYTR